ncbi:hypothetical protein BU198_00485 [Streptomyces sp. CBMA156]|nr:hypothetical protein [Streptomyces sp. CBMA156]
MVAQCGRVARLRDRMGDRLLMPSLGTVLVELQLLDRHIGVQHLVPGRPRLPHAPAPSGRTSRYLPPTILPGVDIGSMGLPLTVLTCHQMAPVSVQNAFGRPESGGRIAADPSRPIALGAVAGGAAAPHRPAAGRPGRVRQTTARPRGVLPSG